MTQTYLADYHAAAALANRLNHLEECEHCGTVIDTTCPNCGGPEHTAECTNYFRAEDYPVCADCARTN